MAKHQFLDKLGIEVIIQHLVGNFNTTLGNMVVQNLSEDSSETQVLSAKALRTKLEEIKAGIQSGESTLPPGTLERIINLENQIKSLTPQMGGENVGINLHVGNLSEIESPKQTAIYFHKDSDEDTNWKISVYRDLKGVVQWITLKDTQPDMSNYWSKDNIDELKQALNLDDLSPLTTEEVTQEITRILQNINSGNTSTPDGSTINQKISSLESSVRDLNQAIQNKEEKSVIESKFQEVTSKLTDLEKSKESIESLNQNYSTLNTLVLELQRKSQEGPIDAFTKQEVNEKLDLKADKTQLEELATKEELRQKVNSSDIEATVTEAIGSSLNTAIEEKLQTLNVDQKADKSYVDEKLEEKVSSENLTTKLSDYALKAEYVTKQELQENRQSIEKMFTDLIDSAPENLNTLGEIATYLQSTGGSVPQSIIESIAGKVDKDSLQTSLDLKADKTQLTDLATKEELNLKADKTQLENLATKAELEPLATKVELQTLATKEEIKLLASKDELQNLATKQELEGKVNTSDIDNKVGEAVTSQIGTKVEDKIRELGLGSVTSEAMDKKADKTELESLATKVELGEKFGKTDNIPLSNIFITHNGNKHKLHVNVAGNRLTFILGDRVEE